MKLQTATLLLASVLLALATGCAAYLEEAAKYSEDICRRMNSPHGPLLGYRLPESGEYVCTNSTEGEAYSVALHSVRQHCEPNCYRDTEETQFESNVCEGLEAVAASMWKDRPYREPYLERGKKSGVLIGVQKDPAYYPDMLPPIPITRHTMLRFEIDGACKAYRHELAEAAEQGRQLAAKRAAEAAVREEARRKREAKRQAQWDRERQKKIARMCPKGLGDLGELIFANPYDVKGRCYGFTGRTLQILSRSTGFYQLNRSDRVYIDFGRDAASGQLFRGYVKGVGVFSYTTGAGAKMIVPSLVVTELPPEEYPARAAD